jgi:hypothetical protein
LSCLAQSSWRSRLSVSAACWRGCNSAASSGDRRPAVGKAGTSELGPRAAVEGSAPFCPVCFQQPT